MSRAISEMEKETRSLDLKILANVNVVVADNTNSIRANLISQIKNQTLNLDNKKSLTEKELTVVVQLLKENYPLTTLSLQGCDLSATNIQILISVLANNTT